MTFEEWFGNLPKEPTDYVFEFSWIKKRLKEAWGAGYIQGKIDIDEIISLGGQP